MSVLPDPRCTYCGTFGHVASDCPDMPIPEPDFADPDYVLGAVLAQLEDLSPTKQRRVLTEALAQVPPDPPVDHNDERNRSYRVRDLINGRTGHDYPGCGGGPVYLTARRPIRDKVDTGDVVMLISTSNAGFNGITAAVATSDGNLYGISLGAFDIYHPHTTTPKG